eukprot:scaffold41939_cov23-Tisochrysis_lutea.AAC.7
MLCNVGSLDAVMSRRKKRWRWGSGRARGWAETATGAPWCTRAPRSCAAHLVGRPESRGGGRGQVGCALAEKCGEIQPECRGLIVRRALCRRERVGRHLRWHVGWRGEGSARRRA